MCCGMCLRPEDVLGKIKGHQSASRGLVLKLMNYSCLLEVVGVVDIRVERKVSFSSSIKSCNWRFSRGYRPCATFLLLRFLFRRMQGTCNRISPKPFIKLLNLRKRDVGNGREEGGIAASARVSSLVGIKCWVRFVIFNTWGGEGVGGSAEKQ